MFNTIVIMMLSIIPQKTVTGLVTL